MTTATDTKPVDATALAIAKNLEQVQGAITEFDKIAAGFAELEAAHPANLACAVDTAKGMKEAIAGRAAWREPRIATEKARKAAKAPVLALGKDIDARAAAITLRLEAGEANYDEQIKAEEARKEAERDAKAAQEARRIEAIQHAINGLRATVSPMAASAHIELALRDMVAQPITREAFAEFVEQAESAKASAVTTLRQMHAAAVEREAEAARIAAEREELTRLRAEQEARDKAERERIAAEQSVERERLAAERATLEQQQAAARAEQQRLDAEAAAARRAADDQARGEREAADRAARAAHAAEQARLDAVAADLSRQQAEADARARRARDLAEEAARMERAEKEHADRKVRDAAPLMFDALKQWLRADEADDSEELANARIARDAALEAAGELLDVPY